MRTKSKRTQLHKIKDNESRTWDVEPLHITPGGIAELERKLAHMKKILPDLALEAARTAAYGDRSDNAEYKQAKGTLRATHRRIFEVEQQLKRAVAIPSGPSAAGAAQLGSMVTIEATGREADATTAKKDALRKTFELVGPAETDPSRGRISHLSPLGAALIGRTVGDVVIVPTGNGSREYRIIKIS